MGKQIALVAKRPAQATSEPSGSMVKKPAQAKGITQVSVAKRPSQATSAARAPLLKRPALATGKAIAKRPAQANAMSGVAKRPAQANVEARENLAILDRVRKHETKGAEQGLRPDDLQSIVQALGPAAALGNLRLLELKSHCKNLGLEPADTKLKIIKQIGAQFSCSSSLETPRKRGLAALLEPSAPQQAQDSKRLHVASQQPRLAQRSGLNRRPRCRHGGRLWRS